MSARDAQYMAHAIRLAERGLYTTKPNPRVGCLIVRDDQIVARAWHEKAGGPHAEAQALQLAGEAARGATAYVSLEPCNHHGRTPPCSQALIDAGIARLVYAVADTGPGAGGADRLRAAGVQVSAGLMEVEARALNPGFHRLCTGGRPWIRLKLAMSLDGRAALTNGQSQWITSDAARRDGHRWRARSDAVLTGIGTVLADDPQMTARLDGPVVQPLRIVLDRKLKTPSAARLRADGQYLILHEPSVSSDNGVAVAANDKGLDLQQVLAVLAQRKLNEVLVEAGPKLAGAFTQAGLVDELIVYQAPSLIGSGLPAADIGTLTQLNQRHDWTIHEQRRVGDDLRIIAHPIRKN